MSKVIQVNLNFIYILEQGEDRSQAEALLTQIKEQTGDTNTNTLIRWGDKAGVLLAEARQEKYDLIILQMSDKTRERLWQGSLDSVISHSVFPSVLILRNEVPDLKHILICTGGPGGRNTVMENGAALAKAFSAKGSLLHVAPGAIPSMYTGLPEFEETLEDLLKTGTPVARHLRTGAEILDEFQVQGELQLRRGVPLDEIVREVRLGKYDLLVIGRTRAMGGIKEMILGDVMQQILTQVRIPVLVIGEEGFDIKLK
jgi:nucleotide-binding universal stress UspA family protein